jgi:dynein intermediate chain 2
MVNKKPQKVEIV